MNKSGQTVEALVDQAYREHSRAVLATLIRLLGGFDLAEEALHDAYLAASETWARDGLPANPRAWLVSAGRFRAIDKLRRTARFASAKPDLVDQIEANAQMNATDTDLLLEDDQLRLIFTCCHPALATEAQVALTLRTVCGLSTEEIASAFLAATPAIAQRIVRAKAKIRKAGIKYEVPDKPDLPARLDAVLGVIYLVFNEGYAAHSGTQLIRTDLAEEAIRLARLVGDLLPDPEVHGLLALMLLQHSRSSARLDADGEVILLADQDRALWNHAAIAEGLALVEQAFAKGEVGPYAIQAAIAAVHARAKTAKATQWVSIVALYDLLLQATPSAVVRLNRAIAVGMATGPDAGIELIENLMSDGALEEYHLAHAALADMHRRAGHVEPARRSYQRALELCQQEPERRFFRRRLDELAG